MQIPCEHCHMSIDFNYLSNALKHYKYQLIDSLNADSSLTLGTDVKRKRSKGGNSKRKSISKEERCVGKHDKEPKREASQSKLPTLKLNYR